jgi:hypothetical protein
MRILKILLLSAISVVLLLSITAYIYLYVLPKGPEITEIRPPKVGKDAFIINAHKVSKRKTIKVWTYKLQSWTDQDKMLFVMHGGGRNADDYLNAWVELADEHNLFIIAPEFENKFSRYTTNDYHEVNLFTFFCTKNPKDEWAFSVVENIFDHNKSVNTITNTTYDILAFCWCAIRT